MNTTNVRDSLARLVSTPLRLGGRHCLFRTLVCVTMPKPAEQKNEKTLFAFIDLETTGLDLAQDNIIELGCTDLTHGANL